MNVFEMTAVFIVNVENFQLRVQVNCLYLYIIILSYSKCLKSRNSLTQDYISV